MNIFIVSGLLNFQRSGDQDGFVGDFSAKTEITSEMYQLKVKTDPSGGIFEASITYDVKNDVFSVKVSREFLFFFYFLIQNLYECSKIRLTHRN